ncbi:MAG TPA: biotin transporter BioY, partial [Alkalispirochaeta sp.]|nr:biotin transporter BioY [Alkalispirochaeta sp.]
AVAAAVIHGGRNRSVAHAGFLRQTLALAAGFLIIYATGVPWLAITADLSLGQAATVGMLPFIPGDIMKAAVLILLVRTVPRAIWQTLK